MTSDPFVEELPFNLPLDQATPDFVILGTGLQQCLLAAHLSKIDGQRGLIIGIEQSYGSTMKTINLKEAHLFTTRKEQIPLFQFITPLSYLEMNDKFYSEAVSTNRHRGYNIDLEPGFIPAAGRTCDFLKEAQMDKYLEFRLLQRLLVADCSGTNSKLYDLPLTKGKIFQSRALSIMEKKQLLGCLHLLAKLYHQLKGIPEDQNSTSEFDKYVHKIDSSLLELYHSQAKSPYHRFLSHLTGSNAKINDYIAFGVCRFEQGQESSTAPTTQSLVYTFGKFLKSCGTYGENPYLYVDNGIGDVPQAFCRIASIFGSTFILHPKITIGPISREDDHLCFKTNLLQRESDQIRTKSIYMGPTFSHCQYPVIEEVFLRGFIVTQIPGQTSEKPALATLLHVPGLFNPVYFAIFDETSHNCPQPYTLYQFETLLPSRINFESGATCPELEAILEIMETLIPGFRRGIKYLGLYLRSRITIHPTQSLGKVTLLKDAYRSFDLDAYSEAFMELLPAKEAYFRKGEEPKIAQDQQIDSTSYLLERLQTVRLHPGPESAKTEIPSPHNEANQSENTREVISQNRTSTSRHAGEEKSKLGEGCVESKYHPEKEEESEGESETVEKKIEVTQESAGEEQRIN